MNELAPEDALRLNVLMAGEIQAIRIDESAMVVHGLSSRGEAVIRLHPTGRQDQYLRRVRELLAGLATGSPGGYPVYLRRWTRMGQARDEGLEKLLLFGEPEAVISVACSAGLTDELARRAWWSMPDAANARRMLERRCVAEGEMGKVLVDYLVEFLPFENESGVILDTVRLVLKSGRATGEARNRLWRMGQRDMACHVGFLELQPDDIPLREAPRADWVELKESLANSTNPVSAQLLRTLSASGQAFLATVEAVSRQLADRDVAAALLDAVSGYFSPAGAVSCDSAESAIEQAARLCSDPDSLQGKFLQEFPRHRDELFAMIVLASTGGRSIFPILSRTTASGTLLRQKLDPVLAPLLRQIAVLRGVPYSAENEARRRPLRGSRSG